MSQPPSSRRPGRQRRVSGRARARLGFERLVAGAVDGIPEPFRSRLENVAIVIEERPTRELLKSLGMTPDETLLGLYDGIPLTERGEWYNMVPPDRIIIFRQPILGVCATAEEVVREVRRTVLHEVAHFYGISDDELDRMGFS